MIRLLIVADVQFYRDGLAHLLSRDAGCDVVGTASTWSQAVERGMDLRPDIVLLDTAVAEGIKVVTELAIRAPAVKVIAIALAETEHAVLEWAEAGVAGYVPRDASTAELIAAIERTARGELQCSPRVAGVMFRRLATLAKGAADRRAFAAAVHLTRREKQIMDLLERGMSNKDIATRLGIQVATTKSHVHHILEKLHVHRRSQATARMRSGTLEERGDDVNPRLSRIDP